MRPSRTARGARPSTSAADDSNFFLELRQKLSERRMWQRERKWLERREVERLVGLHERSDGTCSISQTPGDVIRVLVNEPSALVLCWLVA